MIGAKTQSRSGYWKHSHFLFMPNVAQLCLYYCRTTTTITQPDNGIAQPIRERYKKAMIRKWRNQKEIPTPKTEGWEKPKLTLRYLYQENIS